jgi:succinate-acetate transporter protein
MMWLIKELAPMAAIIGAIMTVFILLCMLLPTEAFFVTFFALLFVFGILACISDNMPRRLEDGKKYCSPVFIRKD